MRPAKIFVTHLESDYSGPLQKAFEWLSLSSAIEHGDSVVIKPNLTFPVFRPGVMTNPEAIEALIVYLKNYTDNITTPVPKVHANAGVSLSLKNQWGVIQEPALRLKLHPYFREVIYQVNKALPKTIVVVDGKYGLTRNGPMRGDAVELNWVLVGDDPFYVDFVVTEMMGLNPFKIPYLNYILKKGGISSLEGVQFNQDHRAFIKERFYVSRDWTDLPGVLTFNSRFLAYVGYESPLAKPLHWLLYFFREPFY